MSSQRCKRCPYSAFCYSEGWQYAFTKLFWEAGKSVGLFRIDDGKLAVPTASEEFECHAEMAEKYMRAKLVPTGCPHAEEKYRIQPKILGNRVDVVLEFPR